VFEFELLGGAEDELAASIVADFRPESIPYNMLWKAREN